MGLPAAAHYKRFKRFKRNPCNFIKDGPIGGIYSIYLP